MPAPETPPTIPGPLQLYVIFAEGIVVLLIAAVGARQVIVCEGVTDTDGVDVSVDTVIWADAVQALTVLVTVHT